MLHSARNATVCPDRCSLRRLSRERPLADFCTSHGCVCSSRGEDRSEEHTSELQSLTNLVCRLLLEKKKKQSKNSSEFEISQDNENQKSIKAAINYIISTVYL